MTTRPYQTIATELGLDETTIIESVKKLKKSGIIRRIGGNFSPEKVGFQSTLCAANVPEDKIDFFCEIVNAYDGVTHNYQRDHYYNIWFTFIAPSMAEIKTYLKQIKQKTGQHYILNLPATHVFKIRAQFNV
jgi:DNA-binding Lrp family transcriptional regulator